MTLELGSKLKVVETELEKIEGSAAKEQMWTGLRQTLHWRYKIDIRDVQNAAKLLVAPVTSK